MAAARKHLEYGDLVEKILELAMHRSRKHEPPDPLPATENGARA